MARKNQPGRKKIELDPAEVETLAAEGLDECQIAAWLGVCQDTLTVRKKESKEIREALKRGQRRAHGTIANAIFEAAKKVADDPRYSTLQPLPAHARPRDPILASARGSAPGDAGLDDRSGPGAGPRLRG